MKVQSNHGRLRLCMACLVVGSAGVAADAIAAVILPSEDGRFCLGCYSNTPPCDVANADWFAYCDPGWQIYCSWDGTDFDAICVKKNSIWA